jgi:outer membrane protein assembly factor BamD
MKLAAAALAVLLLSCAGTNAAKGPLTYSNTARRIYTQGMEAYQNANYLDAIRYFTECKRRFPYSKWALLAELRIADSQFGREQYLEAIDAYKLFIKFHPTNENVPYAQYQIALSYFKQAPEDWFLLPPSYEKDLSAVVDAVKEVKKFIKSYPGSGLLPKARELLRRCERKLGDHELYVARFYAGRDKLVAALMRLEYVRQNLTTLADDPEILLLLGKIYLRLGRKDKAREMFLKLRSDPGGKYRKEVARYLQVVAGGR